MGGNGIPIMGVEENERVEEVQELQDNVVDRFTEDNLNHSPIIY